MIETYEIPIDNSHDVRCAIHDIVVDYCIHNDYDNRDAHYVGLLAKYSFTLHNHFDSLSGLTSVDVRTYVADTDKDIDDMLQVVTQVVTDHYVNYGSSVQRESHEYAVLSLKSDIRDIMREKSPK